MSTVIEEIKRINVNMPMDLYKGIEASDYTTTEAVNFGVRKLLYGKAESDYDQIICEMENKVLAAESKLGARDTQISTYSSMLQEKDKLIAQLKTQLKKATIPKKNIYVLCCWVLAVGFMVVVLITALFSYVLINQLT